MPNRLGAAHWHERAEEARSIAEGLSDPAAKATMLTIAASYDRMAGYAEVLAKVAETLAKNSNPK
jgi:hypothetical protein